MNGPKWNWLMTVFLLTPWEGGGVEQNFFNQFFNQNIFHTNCPTLTKEGRKKRQYFRSQTQATRQTDWRSSEGKLHF